VNRIRRVVFDTSTLVSAALRPGFTPHLAWLKALSDCDVFASPETLGELELVLERSKFDRYLKREQRQLFATNVRRRVLILKVPDLDPNSAGPASRDPEDNKFLALALAAEADAIISSDEDLLVLHPWQGISILSAAQFITANSLEGT